MKTLKDVLVCPNCNSTNCYQWDSELVELNNNGVGFFTNYSTCRDCHEQFKFQVKFSYEITSVKIRGLDSEFKKTYEKEVK